MSEEATCECAECQEIDAFTLGVLLVSANPTQKGNE